MEIRELKTEKSSRLNLERFGGQSVLDKPFLAVACEG